MKAITPPRLLVVSAAAMFMLPSCRKASEARADPEWWRLEAERIEVAHQVELLQLRLSKRNAGDDGYAVLKQDAERGAAHCRQLSARRDLLQQDLEQLRQKVEIAKSDWMRATRGAVVGRHFARFGGGSGRTYEDAVITRVTDVGVEFRHATGSARLAAADLTAAQHEMFGLDVRMAADAMKEEQETALAYGSWVDDRVAAVESIRKEEEEREAQAMASVSVAKVSPRGSTVPIETASRSRLSEPPRSFGNGGTTVWYSGYRYRSYYRPYCYTSRYRPSASVLYDPYSCTGTPSRVNVSPPSHGPVRGWSSPGVRPSGYSAPAATPNRSVFSTATP
jgi:hypothetical protein